MGAINTKQLKFSRPRVEGEGEKEGGQGEKRWHMLGQNQNLWHRNEHGSGGERDGKEERNFKSEMQTNIWKRSKEAAEGRGEQEGFEFQTKIERKFKKKTQKRREHETKIGGEGVLGEFRHEKDLRWGREYENDTGGGSWVRENWP